MGVSTRNLTVSLVRVKGRADGCFEVSEYGAGTLWEFFPKAVAGGGELFESGQGVANHLVDVEAIQRLVKRPQGLDAIRIELEELVDELLWNLVRCELHLVEGAE
jgi:hypothetical protein